MSDKLLRWSTGVRDICWDILFIWLGLVFYLTTNDLKDIKTVVTQIAATQAAQMRCNTSVEAEKKGATK